MGDPDPQQTSGGQNRGRRSREIVQSLFLTMLFALIGVWEDEPVEKVRFLADQS